jgi:hypothetical protein
MNTHFSKLILISSVLSGIISISSLAQANTETSKNLAPSLKQLAVSEMTTAPQKIYTSKNENNDVQIDGALTLNDPKKEIVTRNFKYTLGLKISNLKINGYVTNEIQESFSIDTSRSIMGPALDFGVLNSILETESASVAAGFNLGAAYFNQLNPVTLQSGYKITDSRLATYILQSTPYLKIKLRSAPRLSYELGPTWTYLNLAQTSSSEFSNFNVQTQNLALSQRIGFKINPQWALIAEKRSGLQQGGIQGPHSNINLHDSEAIGLQSVW